MSRADDYYDSIKDDRNAWRDEVEQSCMWCGNGADWHGFEIHEIERRSHACGRWGVRANYLLTCYPCHSGPLDYAPHEKQLAAKLLADPEYFDLEEWLRIRDPELRAPERVTLRDIVRYLQINESVIG